MFIVDAHLDLAYNALAHGRDMSLPLEELRQLESKNHSTRGRATVTFPALQAGGVGLIFGTLFVSPAHGYKMDGMSQEVEYHNADEAYEQAMLQLDYYHRMVETHDALHLVTSIADLDYIIANDKLGIVVLMEGADPIRTPDELAEWHERGLRLVGLAWEDTRYSAGAWRAGNGGLTKNGRYLLNQMAAHRTILDLTHMSEQATLEALDLYDGAIVATHSNGRSLLDNRERHLSDLQIRRIGERDGVIGTVLYNRFLSPTYEKGDPKSTVTLDHVIAHIDHICQLLGDAAHVGIGTDFDGGFGADAIPAELDSAVDLYKIGLKLGERGYSEVDVANIMGGNWVNLLRRAWG